MHIYVSNSLKIIGIIALSVILFFSGCKLLIRDIFNRQECERFNIDNIEVRTGINIPKVSDCDCQVKGNTKTSNFIIDTDHVDLEEYVVKQHFIKMDSLYRLSDKSEHSNWTASLNLETAELRFTLQYLK